MGSWKVLTWKGQNKIENNELGKVQPKVILSNFSQILPSWMVAVRFGYFVFKFEISARSSNLELRKKFHKNMTL